MADINQRINVKVKYIVGNHGLESVIAKKENLVLAKDICTQWQNKIKKQIAKSQNGISIEDKTFSLAIHFRKSRQKKEAKLSILKLIENLQPSPRVIMGKSVINILPAGAPHKGVALLEFLALSKCNRAIYVGDDETDEDVFSLPDNRILSVRIGKKRLSQAQYYINRQAEINKFLLKLIEMYEHSK